MSATPSIGEAPRGVAAGGGGAAFADRLLRILAVAMVAFTLAFLANDYLTFWRGWPGALARLTGEAGGALGWVQLALYLAAVAGVAGYVVLTPRRDLFAEADGLSALAAYIVRATFWVVLLVGFADAAISFLRVEGLLPGVVGNTLADGLGRSQFRALRVHIPLIVAAALIAALIRRISFSWLALLVVLAEFQIVISRFVFSYEQAFMGDMVRFWYAALFLLASAYTLVHEGHVRVDIFYVGFTPRGQARTNVAGCLLLGWPLCWVILGTGLWGRGSSLNSPLLSFEISQSGYGMYVKYIMAAFLIVYAVTMIIQFAAYLLENAAVLRGAEPRRRGGGGH